MKTKKTWISITDPRPRQEKTKTKTTTENTLHAYQSMKQKTKEFLENPPLHQKEDGEENKHKKHNIHIKQRSKKWADFNRQPPPPTRQDKEENNH